MASLHEADSADAPIITPQKYSHPKADKPGAERGDVARPCNWLGEGRAPHLAVLDSGVAGTQSERAAGREEWRLLCFSGGHDEVCKDLSPPPTLSPTSTP